MKCPAKYLGRWLLFFGLYLIIVPCCIPLLGIKELLEDATELVKELWWEINAAFLPEFKRDFMRCLHGEPLL